MLSKVIGIFLLGMLHASADSDEATKHDKAMSKFAAPAAMMARPRQGVSGGRAPVNAVQSGASMQANVLKTLLDLEEQNLEMKVAYQHLRARIQNMPQADGQASFGSAASLGWLAGVMASLGLAASVGVAAVRKFSSHGQQGSESTSDAQISLVPQRTGLITASAATGPARSGNISMLFGKDDKGPQKSAFAYGLPGNFNALGGGELNWDPAGFLEGKSELEVNRYRECEITHGRVGMLASAGFLVQEKFHPLFSGDGGPAIEQIPKLPPWLWAVMGSGIIAAESYRINVAFRELDGQKLKAETALRPGYYPGDLSFDPLGLKPEDPAEFREMQEKELAHARLAMIAAAGFLAQEAVTKATWGTVYGLPDF
jgi:hypothetical protein